MVTLVDFVSLSYKEHYKHAVIGLMLENLEFARDKLLPDWAMRNLGVPDSAIPRIHFQAGILDDAIQELESFEYHEGRGESFKWLAEKYWDALGSSSQDKALNLWFDRFSDTVQREYDLYIANYGEDDYDTLREFFEEECVNEMGAFELIAVEYPLDLPSRAWAQLDDSGKASDIIFDHAAGVDSSYDYDYIRSEAIESISMYIEDADDLDSDLENVSDRIIEYLKSDFVSVHEMGVDLRLKHVNRKFDAALGIDAIRESIMQLENALTILSSNLPKHQAVQIEHEASKPNCAYLSSLAGRSVQDLTSLKISLRSIGLTFVLAHTGRNVSIPPEYSSIFDHVYLLGCFESAYASAKRDVKVEFRTYTGVVEFVNADHYLIRDFNVRGVPLYLQYINVTDLDVGLGAEVRIPLDLLKDSYRDIRIQSRNAVKLTTPTWDGDRCHDPKLHICLDYTETVQVDLAEINRLFFTKKAYIGCSVDQLQKQKDSNYLGKRFPSEFRCSGSLCIVEDGMSEVTVFSNSRYGYQTLVVASSISTALSEEDVMHFGHLKQPKMMKEAVPKRAEEYSNSIVWTCPDNDFSGCSFYKCILACGEPKNSVSILPVNQDYDRTVVVTERIVGEDEDFSLDEWL